MSRRLENRGELLVAKLLSGLHHEHERLVARARVCDHPANFAGFSPQRLGRWNRQHDLARGERLEIALGVGCARFNDDVGAGNAGGWLRP